VIFILVVLEEARRKSDAGKPAIRLDFVRFADFVAMPW
jgi:hypothetical protein